MNAQHARTSTTRRRAASPAAIATSVVLTAGLALPTIMPATAHAQGNTDEAESPSLSKAAEPSSRTANALIRQSLQNAKTTAELQAVLAEAEEAYNQAKTEYLAASEPYNAAAAKQAKAEQAYGKRPHNGR